MKSITVLLLAVLVCFATSKSETKKVKFADKDFLLKQAFVFEIFQHIHQDDVFSHQYAEGQKYNIENNFENYNVKKDVKDFFTEWTTEPISNEEIFSATHYRHIDMASYLVKTLIGAKDWKTFKLTALWARFRVNKELFVYSFSIACLHRPDLEGIILPPIYEIYPYYFFGAETIQQAQNYKIHGFHNVKQVENNYQGVILSNYTGKWGHFDDNNILAYFTEDVGLNAFYYYYNLDYPQWSKGFTENRLFKKDNRGSLYLFVHRQLLARYYMERLSHDLDEIEDFTLYNKFATGYHTGLRYYNGATFPDRDNDFKFHHQVENYDLIEEARKWEYRLSDFIDTDRLLKGNNKYHEFPENDSYYIHHTEALGNLLQGNRDSLNDRYYGKYDLKLRWIANTGIEYGTHEEALPSAINHYETSLRDPIFYSIYKRIMKFYWQYVFTLPVYDEEELFFDGVKIEKAEVSKLTTYYDNFDADITNAVNSTDFRKFGSIAHDGHDFVIKARQWRLNHEAFDVKLTVNSNEEQKATVKFFIGPKYDKYGHKILLEDNYKNFFTLDEFVVDLTPGQNVIERNSNDFTWYVNDRTTYFDLYKKIVTAINADEKFALDMTEAHCGFPRRLMLPRGKKGGMPFQFFFFVYPFQETKTTETTDFEPTISCGVGSGARYNDNTLLGFPFDRPPRSVNFKFNNMMFYDALIYHKIFIYTHNQ